MKFNYWKGEAERGRGREKKEKALHRLELCKNWSKAVWPVEYHDLNRRRGELNLCLKADPSRHKLKRWPIPLAFNFQFWCAKLLPHTNSESKNKEKITASPYGQWLASFITQGSVSILQTEVAFSSLGSTKCLITAELSRQETYWQLGLKAPSAPWLLT